MTVIITNPASVRVQAILIKGHLKMMRSGMRNSGVSRKKMLAKASALTDKKYPNSPTELDRAIADLEELRAGSPPTH